MKRAQMLFGMVLGMSLLAALTLPPRRGRAAAGLGSGDVLPRKVTPELRSEILAAREAVWRNLFANNRGELVKVIPEETLAINSGEEAWQDRAAVLASAQDFAASGAKLARLEYPRTEIQLYGDVAILYTNYLFEIEHRDGRREKTAGRATEVFVKRGGRWVNPGWHLDSGR